MSVNPLSGKGLSNAAIAELLGKKHKKGFYGPALAKFVKSDEIAINPREVWPLQLGDKEENAVTTIAQGFRNAAKAANIELKGEDAILTITQIGEEVFIIHNERANTWQTLQDSGLNDALENLEAEASEDEAENTEDEEELEMPTPEETAPEQDAQEQAEVTA